MPHFYTHERIGFAGPPGARRIVIAFNIGTDPAALHRAQLMSLGHCLSLLALARHEPSGGEVIERSAPKVWLRRPAGQAAPEGQPGPDYF